LTSAYASALRRLSRRDHSEHELRQSLARKGHPAHEIEDALARLRREKAVDDDSFAARYARSRMAYAGLGRNRIRRDLSVRGVARATERGLAEAATEVCEASVLDRVARRYWTAHRADEPFRRMRRLWAFLLRRGFPATMVEERLRALWPRQQDALADLEPRSGGDDTQETS
jgi:regulatory protein